MILKKWKKNKIHLEFYIQQKYLSKAKETFDSF